MNQATLSIILPIYNGTKHLTRCIMSIFHQTRLPKEFIIINDGSTDQSELMLSHILRSVNAKELSPNNESRRFQYQDMLIRYISKRNEGVAHTRNLGITVATSDYIAFIDQDDFYFPGFCKKYLTVASSSDADMIIGGFLRVNSSGKITKHVIPNQHPWSIFTLTYPWGRIIRRSFLLKHDIHFLKTSIGEDVYFDMVAYSYTKRIIKISSAEYVWYDNPNSVSNQLYTQINNLTNPIYTFDRILQDKNALSLIPKSYEEYYFIKFCVWFLLFSSKKSKSTELLAMRDQLFQWLKHNYPNYQKNKNISPFLPKGDMLCNRLIVFLYMQLHHWNADRLLLRILSKR